MFFIGSAFSALVAYKNDFCKVSNINPQNIILSYHGDMVYLFQDSMTHDYDMYYILSMVSLVALVVCQSITSHLKIYIQIL
jgi:hypothetical protein